MEFTEIIKAVIKDQSMIMGEQLAKSQAASTGVVEFGSAGIEEIKISSQNPETVLQKIVDSYGQLFGQASIDVCLGTLRRLPREELNPILSESLKTQLI